MEPILEIAALKKYYGKEQNLTRALDGISFQVMPGEFLGIMGSSGSGKSTLLNQLAGLEKPTRGVVRIGGVPISQLNENQLAAFRQKHIGFVFQSYNLLPELTAAENVAMPLKIRREKASVAQKRAESLLNAMGLADRADHLPSQLSGGERQRVAIARAVSASPLCLLADEPTGNLDGETAEVVIDYLLKLSSSQGLALVIVTHDPDIAARCDRVVRLKNGCILPEEN